MKKLFYIIAIAATAAGFSSCGGQKDYDNYIGWLKSQPASVDTISSPEGYAAYIDQYILKTDSFNSIGVKLNDTQKDEIRTLNMEITESINKKYASLNLNEPDSVAADTAATDAKVLK